MHITTLETFYFCSFGFENLAAKTKQNKTKASVHFTYLHSLARHIIQNLKFH